VRQQDPTVHPPAALANNNNNILFVKLSHKPSAAPTKIIIGLLMRHFFFISNNGRCAFLEGRIGARHCVSIGRRGSLNKHQFVAVTKKLRVWVGRGGVGGSKIIEN